MTDAGLNGTTHFSERDVQITSHQLRVGRHRYALTATTLAALVEVPPVKHAQGMLLTQSVLAVVIGALTGVKDAVYGGLIVLPFAVLWWIRSKPRWMIFVLEDSFRTRRVLTTRDPEFAGRVLLALQEVCLAAVEGDSRA